MSANEIGTLVELLNDFINADLNLTYTGSQCWVNFDIVQWLMYGGAAALPIVAAISFTIRRKKWLLKCCDGRPGVAYPWDALTYPHGRAQLVLAMTLICYPTYLILNTSTNIFSFVPPNASWLSTPLKFVAMLICGLCLHPIFLSVSHPSILTICVALFVTAYQTTVVVLPLAMCSNEVVIEAIIIDVLMSLPTIIGGLTLMVILTVQLVRSVVLCKNFVPKNKPPNLRNYLKSKETYVRNLFKRKFDFTFTSIAVIEGAEEDRLDLIEPAEESKSLAIRDFPRRLMKRLKYKKVEGFHYPSPILCTVAVSSILLYYVSIKMISFLIATKMDIDDFVRELTNFTDNRTIEQVFQNITVNNTIDFGLLLSSENNLLRVTIYCLNCLIKIIIAAIIISTVNGNTVLIFMFLSYRQNILRLYKGRLGQLLEARNQMAPTNAVVGMCKYGGYQVGYCAWAILLQFFAYSLTIGFLWFAVFMPILFGYDLGFTRFLLHIWPTFVIIIAVGLVQTFVTRLCFVASKGKALAIRNRSVFLVWHYYSFAINTVMGLLSCLLRLFKSFAISFVFLSRLDWCSLPPRFRFLDSGHLAYIGQLHTDVAHSHPVMIVFIELLKQSVALSKLSATQSAAVSGSSSKKACQTINIHSLNELNGVGIDGSEQSNSDDSHQSPSLSINRRYGGKLRWFVAYTLVQNPSLAQLRKAARGGPKSSDFDGSSNQLFD